MKKIIFAMALVCFAAAVFASGASEKKEKTYILRASSNLAPGGTVGKGLAKFVELVNEKSGGRIKATANYGSELGSQREQVEMCKTGSLEMVASAPGTGPGTWVPQLQMFEFPYLFKDPAHYLRVLSAMEGEVSRLVKPHGFTAAAGQSMGSRHMLTKKPITKLTDMNGLKMRGPNAVYVAMFNNLGASGTTMDWNEIYNAVQTGVIDGLEASPSMLYSMKFHEVAPYMALTDHISACIYYFFNTKWLESLPGDLQKTVLDCASEAAAYQTKLDIEDQTVALEKMKKEGLTVTSIQNPETFKTACAGMLAEYKGKGPEWASFIDKILAVK